MTQAEALTILKTGANIFLTGEPGAGKTHTVNAYVEYLRNRGVEPAITASTGIAATHISGMTIHSWSGIGIKQNLGAYDLDNIASREYLVKRITRAKVLIIDEISMLTPAMLDSVDAVCKTVRQNEDSFGGMQVIFVGDFFQLPPISKTSPQPSPAKEREPSATQFAYRSSAWQRAKPIICYLTEQHRQSDKTFLDLLSAIRADEFNEDHYELLQSRFVQENRSAFADAASTDKVTKLFSHNADVDRVNDAELEKLPGIPKTFAMESYGRGALIESLKKSCLSPESLQLKVGAAVLFTKNNSSLGFANGTQGEVIGFDSFSKYPIVRAKNGNEITAVPMEWNVEENGTVRATVSQIPLRLAWAITVHKSQGMSLDAAVMDLSRVFEYGQGYVALSRVRTLSGLHLLGINEHALKVHPEILETDKEFKQKSDEACDAFEKLSKKELEAMHKNFILAAGGNWKLETDDEKSITQARALKKEFRKEHRGEQKIPTMLQTKSFIDQGKTITEIAALRQLGEGTIVSHLEQLANQFPEFIKTIAHLAPEKSKIELVKKYAMKLKGDEYGKLSPLKSLLQKDGHEMTFEEIRIARLFF